MFRFPIHPMILIALKRGKLGSQNILDRTYHTLIQQRRVFNDLL